MAKKKASKRGGKAAPAAETPAEDKPRRRRGGDGAGGKKHKASKGLIVYFMACLIEAGAALGESGEVPESADEQRKIAQAIRQFAERMANQVRKFEGDEASMAGGEGAPAVDSED